jgi:hypothetical protein
MNPGIETDLSREQIGRRLAATDIAVLDVDGCMYPGYTQITLGHRLLNGFIRRELRHPPSSLFLLRLVAKGFHLYWIKYLVKNPDRRNFLLQKNYALAFHGIARADIQAILPKVWNRLDANVHPCLDFMKQKMPLGIISLGLDVILDGLPEYLAQAHRPVEFLFRSSNRILWNDGHFAGLEAPVRVGAADKAELFERACARHGVHVPLVIGHNSEERHLCRMADERGGLSIGMKPADFDRDAFHVVVKDGAWDTLRRFLVSCWPGR